MVPILEEASQYKCMSLHMRALIHSHAGNGRNCLKWPWCPSWSSRISFYVSFFQSVRELWKRVNVFDQDGEVESARDHYSASRCQRETADMTWVLSRLAQICWTRRKKRSLDHRYHNSDTCWLKWWRGILCFGGIWIKKQIKVNSRLFQWLR